MLSEQLLQINFDVFGIFSNVNAFVLFMILIGVSIGAISRKLTIAAFGGLLIYTHVVTQTDLFIYDAILYVVLSIVALSVGFLVVSGYLESKETGV